MKESITISRVLFSLSLEDQINKSVQQQYCDGTLSANSALSPTY